MINAIQTALSGLQASSAQVEKSAAKIAAAPLETTDLAAEAIAVKQAEITFKANAAVISTASEMSEEMLHLFDEKV